MKTEKEIRAFYDSLIEIGIVGQRVDLKRVLVWVLDLEKPTPQSEVEIDEI